MEPIIEIRNISKKYGIGHHRKGYIALRDVIAEWIKHPFRVLKKRVAHAVQHSSSKEEFWALRDVNFNVMKGEAIGIIGANGAGKSTMLKILSRITPPTTGEIILRGKVASLLEVGTGFHPELTGRDNIFMNGSILGMTKKEIQAKFDQIVEFSGVEKFIDTPVKHYSSGMYVRLAFSIAAHMEPDILIVDEVLAVGDAEFQKKCLGKMDEVTKTAGRTVLFVSHNMSAIRDLCTKVVLFEKGRVTKIGDADEIVDYYLQHNSLDQAEDVIKMRRDRKGEGKVKFTSFWVENRQGEKVPHLASGEEYTFCFGYESIPKHITKELSVDMAISLENNLPLVFLSTKFEKNISNPPASGIVRCSIPEKFPLAAGIYNVAVNIFADGVQQDLIKRLVSFEVKGGNFYPNGTTIKHSPIYVDQKWTITE